MGSTASERYDLAESDLKSFTRSSMRTKIMLSMLEKQKTASELARDLNSRTSTILHSIKDLTDNKLVDKTTRGYSLTNTGRIQALILDELVSTIITLNKYSEFWLSHDMSGIPLELQKRIFMLGQSEVLRDSPETPLRSLEYFVQELSTSREIHGISPYTVTGYSDAIAYPVREGAKVEIILTDPVMNVVISEYKDTLKELMLHENFKLYRIDGNVRVAFTVTESFLNLGLNRIDGSFDISGDLISKGKSAVEWGLMLFNYYKNMSHQVKNI